MKLLSGLLVVLIMMMALPASAQDMLRRHREIDPTAKLLDDGSKAPETVADYANQFYSDCTKSNQDKSLKDYVTAQCACTAAKMSEFMSLKDMQTLYTKTKDGDFQQGRVMLLAYIPCLYDSVNDFVYDNCINDKEIRKNLIHEKKYCECYGRGMGDYVASKGPNLVPGFAATRFLSEKSVPNPFGHIVTGEPFAEKSETVSQLCIMKEEKGW